VRLEWWHYAAGAALVGGALVLNQRDPTPAPGALAVKTGGLLTSEQARAQQLIPAAQSALERLQADLLTNYHLGTYVGSTRRNPAEQAAIVAKGASATQHSWHLLGRGVDLYPIAPDGKPDLPGKHLELFRTMHQVATRYGWRGLAFHPDGTKRYIETVKGKVWDGGHLEFPEGMTYALAAAGAKGGGLA
jgi:hypothetical protein